MTKTSTLKLVNGLLYVVSTCLFCSGLVLEYRLEGRGLRGAQLLMMTKHTWTEVHFILGLSTATLVVAHLWLNWGWIVKVATSGARSRLIGTVAFAIFAIGVALLAPITLPDDQQPREQAPGQWQWWG